MNGWKIKIRISKLLKFYFYFFIDDQWMFTTWTINLRQRLVCSITERTIFGSFAIAQIIISSLLNLETHWSLLDFIVNILVGSWEEGSRISLRLIIGEATYHHRTVDPWTCHKGTNCTSWFRPNESWKVFCREPRRFLAVHVMNWRLRWHS